MTCTTDTTTHTIGPGIHNGVPDATYRSLHYKSHSDLKTYVRGKPMGNNRRLMIGTALHTICLQGSNSYQDQFYECPTEYNLNKREDRIEYENVCKEVGKEVLRPSEFRLVGEMVKAIAAHDTARSIIKADGENELCIVSKLSGYDWTYKCLIDMKRRACLADLKTTGYRSKSEFKNAIVDYGYASQAAFYVDMYASVKGEFLPWLFVCVSKDTFEVWVEQITNEQLAFGRQWYKDILTLMERNEPAPF